MINKKNFVIAILIITLIFLYGCGNKQNKVITEPSIPNNFVLRPNIELEDDELSAGTAFAVKIEEEEMPIIITAIHIFGPNGGLEEDIPSEGLSKVIKNIELTDAFTGNRCGSVSKVLDIPDAKPVPNVDKDIAAFLADKDINVSTMSIASSMPKKGEIVWLAASVYGGAPKEQKLHMATVIEATNSVLSFEYENNDLVLQATSGAPILNSNGEVIGINISLQQQGDKLIGIANPCASFKGMVSDAVSK